ncbi:MAG: PilZ domain-containing protein [Candidatus Omnitrophica bacterium]|nr:PilZ domain-containing protein [Candidatus Omnitrophota bacterium]
MKQHKKTSERRQFIRHPMCFPLSYRVIKRGASQALHQGNVHTRNISRGGLLFSAKHPAEIDSLIMIKMPFEDKVYNVKGKVVHCSESEKGGLYNIGVSFETSSEAFRVRLIEQMYLISEYRDLRSIQSGDDITIEEASFEWVNRYSRQFQQLYW